MTNSVPVTGLAAEAVYGAVNITITAATNPCLPYLQVASYQIWASTTNDRTAATQVGTSAVPFWQHAAAVGNTQYWYWAKSVDGAGGVSDFFPATTTSSVTATPKTAAALSLTLSTNAIVVPADASGAVTSFAGAATTAKVLDGATDVTGSWSFSAASTGVTVTQSGATFTLTAIATDNGFFDITGTRAGYPNLVARCTVAEARTGDTGAAGASAPALRLSATSQVFQVTAAGANSPASIDFTASLLGGLSGTPTFTVTSGSATLTGTGLTRTLSYANLATDTATIQATLSGSTDYVTVAKIREGAAGTDAVVALLSNEAHTLQADNAGVVGTFVGAVTTITIFEGITNTTGSWTITRTDVGTTSTLSSNTVTLTAMAGDTGYVSITATRSGYSNITKRFSLTKARAGATGPAGASAPALRLSATSQVFQITAAGANSPASIDFTAALLGGLSGTPTFSVTSGSATLTGTGLTRNLTFANLSTDTATIQATLSGSTDTITVAKIREGATGAAGTDAVVALLSNEAHTLQADNAGVVGSFTGAATSITIFQGITDTTASWTLSKADSGVTSTLSGSTVTITAAASDAGYVDITAARSGYTSIVKRFTITKSKQGTQGAAGTSAPALRLSATSQVFQVTAAGVASPTSITFTASLLGGLSGTPTFSVTSGTATLTGSGLTRALAYSGLSTDTATIQATLSGSTDTITVAKVREGATGAAGGDAVIALLSNEAHTLQADNAGTVSSFTGAASTISIYVGATDSSSSWTVTKADTNCTSTLSSRTVTITAMSADSAYVDITATRTSWPTFVKRFTLTKSKAGATGSQGTRGSKHFYVSGQSVWSDTVANTAANADVARQLNDVVTQYNATTFSQTKFWNGSAWTTITQAIDGNLLISGSVGATQISASYVYAGAVNATQVTAGTFTGRTFQTASSGKRVVIDAAANTLSAYDVGGSQYVSIGGDIGGVAATIVAYTLSGATTPGILGVTTGVNTSAGVQGNTQSSGPGVRGTVISGSTGHAVQATCDNGPGDGLYASIGGASATSRGNAVEAHATIGGGIGVAGYVTTSGTGVAGWFEVVNTAGSHGLRGINSATTGGLQGGSGIVGVTGSAGGYAFYKERGGIAPFTGQHDGLLLKAAAVEVGDIVCDVQVVGAPTVNDAITIVERSHSPNMATCVGILVSRRPMEGDFPPAGLAEWVEEDDGAGGRKTKRRRAKKHDNLPPAYDLIVMNSVGEGMVNVCGEGGDIAAGDLITTSSTPGAGMKQADDLVRAHTVGKARGPASFTNSNQVKQIACIYLCG